MNDTCNEIQEETKNSGTWQGDWHRKNDAGERQSKKMKKIRKKDPAEAEQRCNAGFLIWTRADKSLYNAERGNTVISSLRISGFSSGPNQSQGS